MKQATTRILFEYWNEVRGSRMAPTRFEIEPSRIAPILSETFILERTRRASYAFRLAGTKICEQLGRELRGEDFLSLVPEDGAILSKALEAVTGDGAGVVMEIEAETGDARSVTFEAIVLPLVHPASEVTRYLGAMTAVERPAWLGIERLETATLLTHDVIWPDGRPCAFADERQLPFSPELAAARIVKSARRQFRILDGGRKE